VVVIGLGRFGTSVAKTLGEHGHEVLGVDLNMRAVENASDFVTQAVQADATNEDTLVELGLRNFDVAVVAVSSDVKSSVLITLILKRLGVPQVIAKAQDELHGEILHRVGADSVVMPNSDTGVRVAHSISAPSLVDYMEITDGYAVAKIAVPAILDGKQLGDLQLREKHGLTAVVLYRARSRELFVNPSKYEPLAAGDALVVTGREEQLDEWRS
jgi:trk system potassium uptake protein TrkA